MTQPASKRLVTEAALANSMAASVAKVVGVRPESFGAVGDGTTDDTAAVVAAVAAATTAAPRALWLTAGKKYRLTSTVAIDVARVRGIYGNNALVIVDGNFTGFTVTGTHVGSGGPQFSTMAERDNEHHFMVRDLRLRGPATSSANINTGHVGLSFDGTQGLTVTGCEIRDIAKALVFTGYNRNIIISESSLYNTHTAIHLLSGDIHQFIINNNHISNFDRGIYAANIELYNVVVVGNDIEADGQAFAGAGTNLIFINNTSSSSQDWTISGNQLEDHFGLSDAAIRIVNTSASSVFTIDGNYFGNTANGGVLAAAPNALAVTANVFRACKGWAVRATGTIYGLTVAGNVIDGASKVNTDATFIGGLVRIDADTNTRHAFRISGNTLRDFWGQVIDINTGGGYIVTADICDNDVYVFNTAGPAALTEALIDISGGGAIQMLNMRGNKLLGRANTPKGISVSAGVQVRLCAIKDNLAINTVTGTAFTLPTAGATAAVADNFGWVTGL